MSRHRSRLSLRSAGMTPWRSPVVRPPSVRKQHRLGDGEDPLRAQHIAAEFLSRFKFDRTPLPAIALTTDTSVLTAVGTPTICAVGPVGGKAHTPDEYLVVDSLVPRAQSLALAVARLT